ncbi:hypothetical protein MJO29_002113 [Puccinia striiformis f. sp. tritici]|uniref:hypothetical protein n=1 Tax=Puccinia striiformis f. sp. tritici TaxID=168172 RepID=UPI002007D35D|nr:hypothetical protein Pst134EA_002718 [Puccinia striiformis f. sp. tritici]KAH9464305.1 hypothetical protein Pst134EB_003833 [Puccinia striiformis f. sp. tritici]KAH9472092.1 hypothetical protein Pst134EA_002718 [Puccinia striiformis f. sp. tritici]KAI7966365.1 hypothetical protein MJO29_002113 [Puccinia striiformis f. sp. tritici]
MESTTIIQRRLDLILSKVLLKLDLVIQRDINKLNRQNTPPFLESISFEELQTQQNDSVISVPVPVPASVSVSVSEEEEEDSDDDDDDDLIIILDHSRKHPAPNKLSSTNPAKKQKTIIPPPPSTTTETTSSGRVLENHRLKRIKALASLPPPLPSPLPLPAPAATSMSNPKSRRKGKKSRRNKGGGRGCSMGHHQQQNQQEGEEEGRRLSNEHFYHESQDIENREEISTSFQGSIIGNLMRWGQTLPSSSSSSHYYYHHHQNENLLRFNPIELPQITGNGYRSYSGSAPHHYLAPNFNPNHQNWDHPHYQNWNHPQNWDHPNIIHHQFLSGQPS